MKPSRKRIAKLELFEHEDKRITGRVDFVEKSIEKAQFVNYLRAVADMLQREIESEKS